MCVSNGIEMTCAFTKVKLADGFGKKSHILLHGWVRILAKEKCPGEWGMQEFCILVLLSFVGMNRYCGLNYLRPLNDDIISSTTIDLKLF